MDGFRAIAKRFYVKLYLEHKQPNWPFKGLVLHRGEGIASNSFVVHRKN